MTYDQILTLEAIVDSGSFKAAATKLHKTQPSLSVAIKKLEEEFQVQLFDRSEYRPKLTTEGKLFYERAKVALGHMKTLSQFGTELGMGIESDINVGVDGITPLSVLLSQLKNFFCQYTATNLNLSIDYLSGTMEKILNKEIEIGFTQVRTPNSDLVCKPFTKISMIPVCAPDFLTTPQDLEELKKLPQVIVRDTGRSEEITVGVLEGGRRWHVTDMQTKYEIIRNGLGWGRLPNHMIDGDLKKNLLIQIPIETFSINPVEIFMVRHKHKPMGPITKKLWDSF